jgi:hypothetical protein
VGLAVVRDLREVRAPAGPEEIERFETDVVAGFVLARAAAGLSDGTIRGDVSHLEQVRSWFGRPLWDMAPGDADAYFGKVLRAAPSGTRLAGCRQVIWPHLSSPVLAPGGVGSRCGSWLVGAEELGAVVGAEQEGEARQVGAQLVEVVAGGADEAVERGGEQCAVVAV